MSFQNHIKQVAPRLSQIKSRQPAMLLGNKVIVAGIGGNYIPGGQGGGGSATSMDFYKCSAVYSDSTWSGYKAVLNQDGYYEFQSDSTIGLTYNSAKITPIVNQCYTDGALLAVNPYSPDIIQVDANTMFLLQGSLHDKSGHVADANIVNHGIVVDDAGNLTFPNNGYATITAGSLPDTVLCDGHDWTIEARVTITQLNQYDHMTVFGRGDNPRGDITIRQGGEVYYNMGGGNHIEKSNTGIIGEHTIKLTHTSSNVFMIYVDGVAGSITQGSDVASRNYRGYDLAIGTDYYGRYFTPNVINWLRISDCIR